ncbi:hypothetical protein AYI70_g2534 [Smittium culicis]|uniref:Uncharacterized protein n=1 Tax=Smittium culicis TaxID=133412 RepID=A0A1R1Y7Z4_9FUNG|nr:hypothetical protein AYI70_g2534 [Smittium culicis]
MDSGVLEAKKAELSSLEALCQLSQKTADLMDKIQARLGQVEQHQQQVLQVATNWMSVFQAANLLRTDDITNNGFNENDPVDLQKDADEGTEILLIPI